MARRLQRLQRLQRLLRPRHPVEPAVWSEGMASALIPGLGQLTQRRYGTALLHFCSVTAYAGAAWYSGHLWSAGALVFNLWSVIDAVWWGHSSGATDAPAPPDAVSSSSS